MKVFQLTALNNSAACKAAVEAKFAGNYLQLGENVWLLAGTGTAQEACATLGLPTAPGVGAPFNAVIVGVSGYYGFGPNNIWEWMFSKLQQAASDA